MLSHLLKLLTISTIIGIQVIGLSGCNSSDSDNNSTPATVTTTAVTTCYSWDIPTGLPTPRVPDENPMSEVKVELGRQLFYDTRMSANNTFFLWHLSPAG
ncbi:hypothetical protein BGP_5720 [Beggiatoa sp. PS]|nr:hypothetical protein BGP_5720 [Beggiatoa sp. PS]